MSLLFLVISHWLSCFLMRMLLLPFSPTFPGVLERPAPAPVWSLRWPLDYSTSRQPTSSHRLLEELFYAIWN